MVFYWKNRTKPKECGKKIFNMKTSIIEVDDDSLVQTFNC